MTRMSGVDPVLTVEDDDGRDGFSFIPAPGKMIIQGHGRVELNYLQADALAKKLQKFVEDERGKGWGR